ncbi:hypothetical protein [Bartonella tamiae]|uniref:Uncharacterized protein n=1 Tax=Bartonella tamiae Th239 TaxID=1094558 RepID=J1JWP3_9HYPH|nr:hypothetical protein [Bartonella tamiae]EJF89397.1 hypothetical protein ME5_01948 [Bartonella tamiae Th239]EJF92738.1 hypothetical protein MEG_01908 [Bartonella tamiae Th307]
MAMEHTLFEKHGAVFTMSILQLGCFPVGYSGEDDQGLEKGKGYNMII